MLLSYSHSGIVLYASHAMFMGGKMTNRDWTVWPEAHLEGEDWTRFMKEMERTKPDGPETEDAQHLRALGIIREGNYPQAPARNVTEINRSETLAKERMGRSNG